MKRVIGLCGLITLLINAPILGCRGPADPTSITGADGGLPPANPEVEPGTGKPIGPIASSGTGGSGVENATSTSSTGGAGGTGGSAAMGGKRFADGIVAPSRL